MTAFRASYADWKLVKTRACVQVVFEIPIEQADAAYQVLGGMPLASKEVWCGVARLTNEQPVSPQQSVAATPRPVQASPVSAGDELRKPKSPAQIAGYLCTTVPFQKFLSKKFVNEYDEACMRAEPQDTATEIAAETVRLILDVASRRDIAPDNGDWSGLLLAFRLWENHPELEDA